MPVTVQEINQKKEKRASLITQAQEVADRVRSENRNMTPEDQTQFDTIMDEADALLKTVQNEERGIGGGAFCGVIATYGTYGR